MLINKTKAVFIRKNIQNRKNLYTEQKKTDFG